MAEGNAEIPYSFEMPEVVGDARGRDDPGDPDGQAQGGRQGYVPERNPYFKKFTTRTMRPVVNFDTCVKCTLCWIQCPDSCFDVMPDGTYDANMEACCGCGVCEAVCPVENCITMVNESVFEDNASQWEMWRKDKADVHDLDGGEDRRQERHRPLPRLPLPRPVREGAREELRRMAESRSPRASPARTRSTRRSSERLAPWRW